MTERRLFLDGIPDDFNPSKDLVLSASCFVGREHIWPEWENCSFYDPLESPEIKWRDWMRTRILANRLCRSMGAELNLRHGTDYGERYWRELLLLWLLLLIQGAWLRYLQINDAIERWSALDLTVPVASDVGDWIYRDDLDFYHNGPRNRDYDLWLGTCLLQTRAPPNWKLVPTREVGYRCKVRIGNSASSGSFLRRLIARMFRRRAFYNLQGGGKLEFLLSAIAPVLTLREQQLGPTVDQTSEARRYDPFPDDFLLLVDMLTTRTMPETLAGNYLQYDREAASLSYKRGRLFVSGASKYVPENRFMTAHALERGERVIRYQHGSSYGSSHIMIAHEMEYYDHGFISWGWRSDGRIPRPATPLPAPTLSNGWKPHRRQSDDIIFVGTNIELGPYPFKPSPNPRGFLEYRNRKIEFFNHLTPAARQNLRYRPYANADSDLDDLGHLQRAIGQIPLVTGLLKPALLGCALAVIDHPGTAVYQALAANVPTILVWDKSAWHRNSYGSEQLALLEDSGIFVADPAMAAQKINGMYGQIEEWWLSDQTQSARQKWCNNNALSQRTWWYTWLREFVRG